MSIAKQMAQQVEDIAKLDPRQAAERVIQLREQHTDWLDQFSAHLDKRRSGAALARILEVWGLSQSAAARVFGVSRQAISKWFDQGVPAERVEMVADLAAATDLLIRHIKRDRISAVVRRPAGALQQRSLLELLSDNGSHDVLAACRAMFSFERAHA